MMSMATINALQTDLCFRHDMNAYQKCLQHQALEEMKQEVWKNATQQFQQNVRPSYSSTGRA